MFTELNISTHDTIDETKGHVAMKSDLLQDF